MGERKFRIPSMETVVYWVTESRNSRAGKTERNRKKAALAAKAGICAPASSRCTARAMVLSRFMAFLSGYKSGGAFFSLIFAACWDIIQKNEGGCSYGCYN